MCSKQIIPAWRLRNSTHEVTQMKRGRPALRATFREGISNTLSQYTYPVTIQTIRKALLKTATRPGSFDTIKKYLEELTADGIVIRQPRPAERKQKPMVLYLMRGRRSE